MRIRILSLLKNRNISEEAKVTTKNCIQEKNLCLLIFYDLSGGVPWLVVSFVSSRNPDWMKFMKSQSEVFQWFLELTLATKKDMISHQAKEHENSLKRASFFICLPICLRSFLYLERCERLSQALRYYA